MVPRVEIAICGRIPTWPLAPFNSLEPIKEEEGEELCGFLRRTIAITHTYELKARNDSGAEKTFKVEVECIKYGEDPERVDKVKFLFD